MAANNDTYVAFKNCAPFSTCNTEINDVFIDKANHSCIAMPMYNLIEYSDNYADTSRSLWQFKRDEPPADNADLAVVINDLKSFEYNAALVGKTANAVNNTNISAKSTKIVVPLKYLSNFWRSLETALINCKIHLELNWIKDFILSSAVNSAKLKITDVKLHFSIVTLSTKDNVNLAKQLSIGFKRSACWSSYQNISAKGINKEDDIYELLTASLQGVRRLFVLAYDTTANNEAVIKTIESIFFQQEKLKTMMYWSMEEIL